MKRTILLLIILCFFVGCIQENSKNPFQKQIDKSSSFTKDSPLNKNKPEDGMLKHLKEKYSNVYLFEEGNAEEAEGEEIQYLAINYLDNKNINFYLYSETLPCDTEYFGIAVRKDQNDFIIYSKEENEYKISIQLNLDKSEATINYVQKDSLETDCLPIDQTIMKKVK